MIKLQVITLSVSKCVITAAGLGTRLLPMSKELPKEMLPVYVKGVTGELILKPVLQALFEQLYSFDIREFCFVVGRGKRAIEDHFIPDWDFVTRLKDSGKTSLALEMENFYRMLTAKGLTILWINQSLPRGFGHAVLIAKPFSGNTPFFVCAGDTVIISSGNRFIHRMVEDHLKSGSDVTILLQEVHDPRQYGVAIVEPTEPLKHRVLRVVEKPSKPPSNLAIMPTYVFNPSIMDALENIEPGVGGEIQLTDAIQCLIDSGHSVRGIQLDIDEIRLDIGTPETYYEAISKSYKYNSSPEKLNRNLW